MLNEVYSPTQEQFDRAWDILDAYRKATEDDRTGAVMFGDEMIDEASRKMATKFVTRGEGGLGLTLAREGSTPPEASSLSRGVCSTQLERAITLRARVSSAPSKMESTRASTK